MSRGETLPHTKVQSEMSVGPCSPSTAFAPSGRALHVLTLTPFYPVLENDARGCFVAEPLPWLEPLGVVNTVFAVQPFYRGLARASSFGVSARWCHYFALPGSLGLPVSGASLFARLVAEVRRLNDSKSIDIIHAHAPLPCGHAAALISRELGIPFVVTVHGLDAFSTNQAGGLVGQWCKRVSRFVYRSACRVICISEKVCEQVSEGTVAHVNTAVIYNGVDPQVFSPSTHEAGPAVILSVGNLIPVKGHELLLRALAGILRRQQNLSWEIIGEGAELSRLERLSRQLGVAEKIHFLGLQSRSQVAEAMRRCTIFALPSGYEGLGCVYLEAMSAAKPVIACRGQGIEEVIEPGLNGWLVDPDDLRGLTEALSMLLQNTQLRLEMGAAARNTILQSFTLAYQAARLVRLYRECVK
jgi:teichuronic acid biosynthesis glycosyltransferase TuaC